MFVSFGFWHLVSCIFCTCQDGMYVQAVCTVFWFLSLSRYKVGSKYLKNLSSCVLPYLLHNHNFQNFHFQKCVTGPRCAAEAAEASEAICCDYEWGRGRAEIDHEARFFRYFEPTLYFGRERNQNPVQKACTYIPYWQVQLYDEQDVKIQSSGTLQTTQQRIRIPPHLIFPRLQI